MEAEERRRNAKVKKSTSAMLSLEEELAEATRDLLDIHHRGSSLTTSESISTLQLSSRPSSGDIEANSSARNTPRINVAEAYGIDKGARLTPLHEDRIGPSRTFMQHHAPEKNIEASRIDSVIPRQASSVDLRFPESHLNDTAAPLDSGSIPARHVKKDKSAVHDRAEAIERDLCERLRVRQPKRSPQELLIDADRSRQMDGLQARLSGSRTPGLLFAQHIDGASSTSGSNVSSPVIPSSGDFRASTSRAPAFFLQSFPDAISYIDRPPLTEESTSDSSDASFQDTEEVASTAKPSNMLMKHVVGTSDDAAKASHPVLDRQEEAFVQDFAVDGADLSPDEALQELAPASSIKASSDDAQSLLSLSATADTGSSGSVRRNSRKRQSKMMRRRSSGNQSLITIGSSSLGENSGLGDDDDTIDTPFARTVMIRGFSIVGAKARGHVAYDVRVTLRNGTMISILRRFSSFVALRQALVVECGDGKGKARRGFASGLSAQQGNTSSGSSAPTTMSRRTAATILPALPPRGAGLLHKYAAHHLETRRLALQRWLQVVMLDEAYGTSAALRRWVVGADDDEQQSAAA